MNDNIETKQLTPREAYWQKKRADRWIKQVAFHEAGHTVCAHLLDTEIEHVAICVKDGSGYCQAGASHPEQYVIRLYAGLIGQNFAYRRLSWLERLGSDTDEAYAEETLRELEGFPKRSVWTAEEAKYFQRRINRRSRFFRRLCNRMMTCPCSRHAVEVFAGVLMERQELGGEEATSIITEARQHCHQLLENIKCGCDGFGYWMRRGKSEL